MTDVQTAAEIMLCPIDGLGPEDISIQLDGSLLTGLDDGRLLRIASDFKTFETICDTGGRPLGLELKSADEVIVCDARKGLLSLNPASGQLTSLVDKIDGQRLSTCNNPAIASDGTIYFSASTSRYEVGDAARDVIEGIPTGRLFRRQPDGRVEQLLDGLYFANGLALSPDEQFVLVAETGRARITRLWLTGPKQGHTDLFADDMPGLPDNLNVGSDGLIWVAMVTTTWPETVKVWSAPFWIRWIVARLPAFLSGRPERVLLVTAIDFEGRTQCAWRIENGDYHFATTALEHDRIVYLCSIHERAIGIHERAIGIHERAIGRFSVTGNHLG